MLVDLFCSKSKSMKIIKKIMLSTTILMFPALVSASSTASDSLDLRLKKIENVVTKLSKLKVSGYLQGQFQVADSMGISSPAGGNFSSNTDKRFGVRRGRVKFTYNPCISMFVLQLDATEKGVGVKDAFMLITDPWTKNFNLTTGMFTRPFGHELEYSSSKRESPERGRMSPILFPGERDLGVMLSFAPQSKSKLSFMNVDLAIINGTGPSTTDFDVQKDIVGRIQLKGNCLEGNWNYTGGFSFYDGGWRSATSNVFSYGQINGVSTFIIDSTSIKEGEIVKKSYMGINAEASLKSVIGKTTFRAEYIFGEQAATSSSSSTPTSQPTTDAYLRDFDGLYAYFIQDIGKSKHSVLVKYDWYDPNTNVSGNQIGEAGSMLNTSDVRYETLGLGYVYKWDSNVTMTAYYDMVTNEITKLSGLTKDLRDSVFTLRLQYKF